MAVLHTRLPLTQSFRKSHQCSPDSHCLQSEPLSSVYPLYCLIKAAWERYLSLMLLSVWLISAAPHPLWLFPHQSFFKHLFCFFVLLYANNHHVSCRGVNPEYNAGFWLKHFPLHTPMPLPPRRHHISMACWVSESTDLISLGAALADWMQHWSSLFSFLFSPSLTLLLLPASLITCLQLHTTITLLPTLFKPALSYHIDSRGTQNGC